MYESRDHATPLTIRSGMNRPKQVARNGYDKLFDTERRATFLQWFATTCNVTLSAEQADVSKKTVYEHRRKDAEFAAAWDDALAQGYAALEAGLVADAIAGDSVEPVEGDEGIRTPGPPPPLTFEQRMGLLREYRRTDGGRGPRAVGKAPSVPPRIATPAEAEAALIERLKHFAVRVAAADAEGRSVLDDGRRIARSGIPITRTGREQPE